MADKFKIQGDIFFRANEKSLDSAVSKIKSKLSAIDSIKQSFTISIPKGTVKGIDDLNSKLLKTKELMSQIELYSRMTSVNLKSVDRKIGNIDSVRNNAVKSSMSLGEDIGTGVQKGIEKAKPKVVSLVDTFLGGVQVRFSQFLKFAVAAFIVDQARTAFNTGFEAVLKIDDAQNKLRQITGETKSNVAELGQEIAELGRRLGTSTTGLAKVAETIAQAGFSLSQTRDIVKEIALTELAPSFGNLDETTDALIAVTEQFELIDKASKKTPAISKYFDIVNRLSKEYAVEAKDLSEATKLAGASFAAASNIQPGDIDRNLDEFRKLASLITVVRSQTRISAPQIGTGIKTLSTRLQNLNIQDQLDSIFGYDLGLRDQEGQFIGVLESFAKIEQALDRLGDKGKGTSEVFAQVTQALGGDRQAKILPAILQRTAEVYDVLANARRNDNSVLEDSILAQERVSIKLAKINREIISFAVGVAESSGFKQFLDYLYKITKAALATAEALKPLLPLVNLLFIGNIASFAGRKLSKQYQRIDQDLLSRVNAGPSGYLSAINSGSKRRGSRNDSNFEDYLGFNRGGYVNALVTPGEEIFSPNQVDRIGKSKLSAYNYAGSSNGIKERGMIVPGQGNSDSVPMQLPHGSFVVRKNSVERFASGGRVGFEKFAGGSKDGPKFKIAPLPPGTEKIADVLNKVFGILVRGMTSLDSKTKIPRGLYRDNKKEIYVDNGLKQDQAIETLAHEMVHGLGLDKESLLPEKAVKARTKAYKSSYGGDASKEANTTAFEDAVRADPKLVQNIADLNDTLLNEQSIKDEAGKRLATQIVAEQDKNFVGPKRFTTQEQKDSARVNLESQVRQERSQQAGSAIKSLVRQAIVEQGRLDIKTISARAEDRAQQDSNDLIATQAKQQYKAQFKSGINVDQVRSYADIANELKNKTERDRQLAAQSQDKSDNKIGLDRSSYLGQRKNLVAGIAGQKNSSNPLTFLDKAMKEKADNYIAEIRKESKKPSTKARIKDFFSTTLFSPIFGGGKGGSGNPLAGPLGGPSNDPFSAFRGAQSPADDANAKAQKAYEADKKLLRLQKTGNLTASISGLSLLGGGLSATLLQQSRGNPETEKIYSSVLGGFGGAAAGANFGALTGNPIGVAAGAVGGAALGTYLAYKDTDITQKQARREETLNFYKNRQNNIINSIDPKNGLAEKDKKSLFQNAVNISDEQNKINVLETQKVSAGFSTTISDIADSFIRNVNPSTSFVENEIKRNQKRDDQTRQTYTDEIISILDATEQSNINELAFKNSGYTDKQKAGIDKKLEEINLFEERGRTTFEETGKLENDSYKKADKLRKELALENPQYGKLAFTDIYRGLTNKEKEKVNIQLYNNKDKITDGTFNFLDAVEGIGNKEDKEKKLSRAAKIVVDKKNQNKKELSYKEIARELDSFVLAQTQKADELKKISEVFDFSLNKINEEISNVGTGKLGGLKDQTSLVLNNTRGSSLSDIAKTYFTLPNQRKDISSILNIEKLRRTFLSQYQNDKSGLSQTEKINNIFEGSTIGEKDSKFLKNEINEIFNKNYDTENNVSTVSASEIDNLFEKYKSGFEEPVKAMAALRDKMIQNFTDTVNDITERKISQRQLSTTSINRRFESDRSLASIQGINTYTGEDQYKQQVNSLLGTKDFRLNPDRLFNNLEQNKARIEEIKKDPTLLENKELQNELQGLITATTSGTQALDLLADRSIQLGDVMSKISEDQRKKDAARNVVLDSVYGGAKSQQATQRSFNILKQLESGNLKAGGLGEKGREELKSAIDLLKNLSPEAGQRAESLLIKQFGAANGLTGQNIAIPFGGGNLNFNDVANRSLDPQLLKERKELLNLEDRARVLKSQLLDKEISLLEKRLALNPNDKDKQPAPQLGNISISGRVAVDIDFSNQKTLEQNIDTIVTNKVRLAINDFVKANQGFNGI